LHQACTIAAFAGAVHLSCRLVGQVPGGCRQKQGQGGPVIPPDKTNRFAELHAQMEPASTM
jgi:hypothetical protein